MYKIKIIAICILLLSVITPAYAFPDTENHWAEDTIEWATGNDILAGYPDGTMKPDNPVTEAEFLTMLLRALIPDMQESNSKNHWADTSYSYAYVYNMPVNGHTSTELRNAKIKRTQVAEIVSGTQGVNYTGRDAILYLLLNGLAKGRDPENVTVKNFAGEENLTRAEAATFIKNVLDAGVNKAKVRPTTSSTKLPTFGDNEPVVNKEQNSLLNRPVGYGIDLEANLSQEVVERLNEYSMLEEKEKSPDNPLTRPVGSYFEDPEWRNHIDNGIFNNDAHSHIERKLGTSNWEFIPAPKTFYRNTTLGAFYGDDMLRGVMRVKFSSSNNMFDLDPGVWYEADVETGWFYGAYLTDNPADRIPRLELRMIRALSEWQRIE